MSFNGTIPIDGGFQVLSTGSVYIEDGYKLTNNQGTNFFIDNGYSLAGSSLAAWDDDVFEFDTTGSLVTFTRVDGGNFDFLSATLGAFGSGSAALNGARLQFTGYLQGGGTVVQEYSLARNSRASFVFAGFSNLTKLEVSAPLDGTFPVMDDFTFANRNQTIPEPSSLSILMAFGILSKCFSRRRP